GLGISAISDGRPSSQPIGRRRSRTWYAAGSDRGERALSLRPQPDVSRAPDFHAGLGGDVRLVVRAGAVRRAVWFHRRVREDEARLQAMFGAPYLDYQRRGEARVPRPF